MLLKAWKKRKEWRSRHYQRNQVMVQEGMLTLTDLINTGAAILRGWWKELPEARRRLNNLPASNMEIGARHFAEANYPDAMLRYQFVLKLEPGHLEARYRLGRCQQMLGRSAEAIHSYRQVLQQQPEHREARFMLAVLGEPGQPITQTPFALVREQFDLLAPVYDMVYVEDLHYQAPQEISILLRQWFELRYGANEPSASRFHVVDIGCGTGQTGRKIRYIARRLVGVDFSRMVDFIPQQAAEERPLYDAVIAREAGDFLGSQPEGSVEVITAGGMLNYNGDLSAIFRGAALALSRGGAFAFTLEGQEEEGVPILLQTGSGRFRHSMGYIRQLAAEHGFTEVQTRLIMLYQDIPGKVCLFTRN